MYNIVASSLINDLILNRDPTSHLILDEIKKAQSLVGQTELLIEIDSDDDFAVDGKSSFSKSFLIGNRDLVEVYKDAIKSITFGHHNQKNYKLDRFLEDIMTEDFLNEVATGHASTGGNQTIDVCVIPATTVFTIGSLNVDLTK